MDAALAMLGRRPYSRRRLEHRLGEKFDADEIEPVLLRLDELGLLDDRGYAEAVVRQRFSRRHYGVSYIRAKLLSDGIEADVADEVLARLIDDDTERRHAREALEAFLRRSGSSARGDAAARHLSNRGFQAELICDLLRESL